MFNIAWLQVRLSLLNPGTYVVNFGMPVIMMVVLALAISGGAPSLRLDVVNQDEDGEVAAELITQLEALSAGEDNVVVICVYGAADIPEECDLSNEAQFEQSGLERLEEGDAAAALIIPEGFRRRC
ncbi:MAG: ABC transporter permease [Anaerolineae bacterium]|nr:ABC transporter permease [Anaerolineae bacterium]